MNPSLYDLSTPTGIREIVAALFMGYNYRLYTEGETRTELVEAYSGLVRILRELPLGAAYETWMESLRETIERSGGSLEWWLLGLGKKTADNLGVTKANRLEYLEEVGRHLEAITRTSNLTFEDAMLMLWAGAATLTVRGSRKSKVGKRLESALMRSGLTILGLREGQDFWMNMPADAEVDREIDAEITTKRGRIRLEIGLIEAGNPEVIMDKITRVGQRGIVIFDRLGPKSNAPQVAENTQVALIQIRNNRPLREVFQHLEPLVDKTLLAPPDNPADIRAALDALPDEIFLRQVGSE